MTEPYKARSLNFAQEFGLEGIHTPWKMPKGATHKEVQTEHFDDFYSVLHSFDQNEPFDEKAFKKVHTLFDALLKENPALRSFAQKASKDPETMVHVAYGAVSQFNLDDITFFTNSTKAERNAVGPRMLKETEIMRRVHQQLFWMPSEKTLDTIIKQLDQRANISFDTIDREIDDFMSGKTMGIELIEKRAALDMMLSSKFLSSVSRVVNKTYNVAQRVAPRLMSKFQKLTP